MSSWLPMSQALKDGSWWLFATSMDVVVIARWKFNHWHTSGNGFFTTALGCMPIPDPPRERVEEPPIVSASEGESPRGAGCETEPFVTHDDRDGVRTSVYGYRQDGKAFITREERGPIPEPQPPEPECVDCGGSKEVVVEWSETGYGFPDCNGDPTPTQGEAMTTSDILRQLAEQIRLQPTPYAGRTPGSRQDKCSRCKGHGTICARCGEGEWLHFECRKWLLNTRIPCPECQAPEKP